MYSICGARDTPTRFLSSEQTVKGDASLPKRGPTPKILSKCPKKLCLAKVTSFPSSFTFKITSMSKTKKSLGEVQLAKQNIAINKRVKYATIKQDPELYNIIKEKEKKRYKYRKEALGQFVSINEKSPREQRVQRKKWREAAKRYREKKKNEAKDKTIELKPILVNPDNSNETTTKDHLEQDNQDPLTTPIKSKCNCSVKIKRIRYLEYNKRRQLLKIIMDLKKENKRLTQNIYGQKLNETKEKSKNINFRKNLKTQKTKMLPETKITKLIKEFYVDDANSTICPGKKQYITRFKTQMQKRTLKSSIKDLHEKFMKIHKIRVSYCTFWKCRPFWVLPATAAQRDTCMCEVHANIDLKLESLFKVGIIREKNHHELLESLCCSRYAEKCLKRECGLCKRKNIQFNEFSNDAEIVFYKWIRSRELISTKKGPKTITITKKDEIKAKPLEVINELGTDMKSFFEHCYLIYTQYSELKELKNSLTVNSAVIHVDFSENYRMKAASEVQSLHFGGSRKEIVLHTAVIYAFDFHSSDIKPTSVCTVSECLRHDAPSIWAHLLPLIKESIKINPFLDTLHFQSDSPTSQYRNKYMFFILSQFCQDFPQITTVTWNYTEAGHGKGAADGVGAVVKRTADFLVNHGTDITSIDKFMTVLQTHTNVTVIAVNETDVRMREQKIPSKLDTFKGTLKVHQVLWQLHCDRLTLRSSSCFKCTCGQICDHGKHLGFIKIPHSAAITINQDEDRDHVTILATTKRRTLCNVTNLQTNQKVLVAGPSNIKILSNKLIQIQKK
ncbi:uncharacterized protein LOC124539689 [Vanessa cardui]|uniref:uncharacterized protein LOC124539689 n=1 Tax=Vanessa cardui TaxID=171605 RepID=UPI001F13F930|nr:uncharacterized protein LOC124539689 [Vanessa cardui]